MKLKTLIPALLCASGIASAKSPVETYGDLSIKNAKLVDSTGSPVTLRGMSLFHHLDYGGDVYWNSSVVSYTQVNWHNSIIRCPVFVEDRPVGSKVLPGYISLPSDAMTKLRRVINGAIESGSYVIVDWHTEKLHEAEAKSFFGELAKEYGNTPNILWEIYNEPNGVGWGQIAPYAKNVIKEIRNYSDNVVIVGNSPWSQRPHDAGTELDGFQNIAYTVHFYNDHSVGFGSNVSEAVSKGHAVFASEWGMSRSDGGGDANVSLSSGSITGWLDMLNTSGISHCNWSLGSPNLKGQAGEPSEASAALNGGVTSNPKLDGTGWSDADLTPSGKAIKGYLVSKNPTWTLSDTTTRLKKALSITTAKKTDFILGTDTVAFAAGFSKSVPWTLALVGKTSGAKRSYTGTGTNVAVVHAVNLRAIGSAAWQAGETVDATLSPVGAKVSYALSTTSNSVHLTRLHETRIRWEGSRIYMPDGLISASAPVRVVIRNAQGQILWQKSASMGTYGWVELSEAAPRFSSVQFIEVHSDEAIVRSSWAPSL